jgi:hypothetical protein
MIDQRLRALLPLFAAVFIDIFSFVAAQAKPPRANGRDAAIRGNKAPVTTNLDISPCS